MHYIIMCDPKYFVFGVPQRLELIALRRISYLPLCVRDLGQICIPCVNKNNFEHVRIFASPLQPS